MRRKWTFSKLLLLLESAVVLYTTYEGFALARLAVGTAISERCRGWRRR